MSFATNVLSRSRPASLRAVSLPRRKHYHPSPADWRDEVLYFLLVDRFSDGREKTRKLLDRSRIDEARPAAADGQPWRWDRWALSGAERWQGGNLKGVKSKLGYLKKLGVTAIWLSPIFKQRGHLNTYHGYGVQDYLDVDPRFGDRHDLVNLVAAAHKENIRVILDVIFNHSGDNWVYPEYRHELPYTLGHHEFGAWLGREGEPVDHVPADPDEGVWPKELQKPEEYTRAGRGDLGAGAIDDPYAEHKRTDFCTLRDFELNESEVLHELVECFKYWIALTDCDGFRVDTVKHVSIEQARNFCGALKEFATNLDKTDFFLMGEIAGGDNVQDRYLDTLTHNLNAVLDIGEMRPTLTNVAKGLAPATAYFQGFQPHDDRMGSHRNLGTRHISILDDHDHVCGIKQRFATGASNDHQAVAGTAIQLLTLGIPCLYYGTEQNLAGPEPSQWQWLPNWGKSDRYLREAMFGPEHPRCDGRMGLGTTAEAYDQALPGFGPFGTAGRHCFDEKSPSYTRIAALIALRQEYPVLRHGRQYQRPISLFGGPFEYYGPGELVAWSRILDDEEVLCVLNAHGTETRGGDVLIDARLNPLGETMAVVLNTAQTGNTRNATAGPQNGQRNPVRRTADGKAYVEIRDLPASEIVILTNHREADDGGIV